VPTPKGLQIPIAELASITFDKQPHVIKSEDTFLVGYVVFDKKEGFSEVEVVNRAKAYLENKQADGILLLPAGVSYTFTGSYENHIRAQKRLTLILPLSLLIIFLLIYLQFRSVAATLSIFFGILVAWAGGFIFLWFYSQKWFFAFSLFGLDLRELFHIQVYNLSMAVWVGFLALFGIATDDGVLISTYIQQRLTESKPQSRDEVNSIIIEAGKARIRPALMTTATTLLALLPVLTSSGRGADIMRPMAIPVFGGMVFGIITVFVVPVLWGARIKESKTVEDTLLPD
jgi:copper/silver efflux system protein